MTTTIQKKITSAGSAVRILLATLLLCIGAAYISPAPAATLLPLAEQTFDDANGNPLTGGTVQFYVPGTTTPKDTWQDAAGTILNTNPIVLNAAGRAIIYGSGSYRQVVKDSLGSTIWDQVTTDTAPSTGISWGGTSTGTANAQAVTASSFSATAGSKLLFIAGLSNTSATTVNPNGSGAISVVRPSLAGSVALTGGEISAGNLVELDYDGTQFNLIDAVSTPIAGTTTDIVSAATTDIGTIASHNVRITGTTTITSFGSSASVSYPLYFIRFAGALTITNNASSLVIPGGQNILTAAGDNALVEYMGSGNWLVRAYNYANPPWVPPPQGRLTLVSGSPVMTTDTATSSSVFYTPYVGNQVPIFTGVDFSPAQVAEQTLSLVASHAANSNYDVFEAINAGTPTLCTGPAWTSDTGRGSGAGTTELERKFGIPVNKNQLVACRNGATTFSVAIDSGTFLGTLRTTGSTGTTTWVANPAAAAGGGNAQLYLWNMYNRVQVTAVSRDSTDSWTYTTATFRAANNNNNNRITAVFGLNEDAITTTYSVFGSNSTGGVQMLAGVGLDSTSAFSGVTQTFGGSGSQIGSMAPQFNGQPGLGLHFFQALEYSTAVGTTTWYGDNGAPTVYQSGLFARGAM